MPGESGAKGRKGGWTSGRRACANRLNPPQPAAQPAESKCGWRRFQGRASRQVTRLQLGCPFHRRTYLLNQNESEERGQESRDGLCPHDRWAGHCQGCGWGVSYLKQEIIEGEDPEIMTGLGMRTFKAAF